MQRFSRIEALLGAPLDRTLSRNHLQRLVDEEIAEDEDLDFKRESWPKTPDGREELAKDVAALANRRGGVLIVGIATAKDRASKLMPWMIDDAVLRHVRAVVADHVHPHPEHDMWIVPDDTAGLGFLVIAVPRSMMAPHAVSRPGEPDLRYWSRDGSRTRWLAESEVADAYAHRLSSVGIREGRLETLIGEGAIPLFRPQIIWLCMGLVPHLPGAMHIDFGRVDAMTEWFGKQQTCRIGGYELFEARRVSPAVGRLTMRSEGPAGDGGPTTGVYFEMHTDGAGFGAVPLHCEQIGDGPWKVYDDQIVDVSTGLLRVLARHMADNAGSWGDADVEVQLLEPRLADDPPSRSLTLWSADQHGNARRIPGTRPLFTIPSRRHTIAASLVTESVGEWLVASRLVASDVLNAFGLAEPRQITSDGSLRPSAFAWAAGEIATWAKSAGIGTV